MEEKNVFLLSGSKGGVMKLKQLKIIEYVPGEEENIQSIIFHSKEPILFKIKNFPDQFTLDYFVNLKHETVRYSTHEKNQRTSYQFGNYNAVLAEIIQNKPYRIFGQFFQNNYNAELEKYVPLWQTLPLRPKFFSDALKILYFFGGKGAFTRIHFDREHCCILHLCLSGTKKLLLFTEDQSEHIYKVPFIGDSLIDFSQPLDTIHQQFPRINQAEGYQVTLEKGDMLFMPKNCWHYTEYLEPSSAASYAFYPKKYLQFYGYITGYFYIGYKSAPGFAIAHSPFFIAMSQKYALATGAKKYIFKFFERMAFILLLPAISLSYLISLKVKRFKKSI